MNTAFFFYFSLLVFTSVSALVKTPEHTINLAIKSFVLNDLIDAFENRHNYAKLLDVQRLTSATPVAGHPCPARFTRKLTLPG